MDKALHVLLALLDAKGHCVLIVEVVIYKAVLLMEVLLNVSVLEVPPLLLGALAQVVLILIALIWDVRIAMGNA
jgi:hypothetical protein